MNCFQFDYFCGYHTADKNSWTTTAKLWIAFNLITFVDITQHILLDLTRHYCCELLSIWLLLWISHSYILCIIPMVVVVNCFQFDYFCGYHTAFRLLAVYALLLWIAFNLITFVDITQQERLKEVKKISCELLSIWLLLWISHSIIKLRAFAKAVVNCFQFDYFCGYHTAR